MQLSSFLFLIFLFLVIIFNYLIPRRFRWIWLLVVSYLFCIYADPKYAVVLAGVTAISYTAGILIKGASDRKRKKLWLILGVILSVAPLFVTKYLNFSIGILNDILQVLHRPANFPGIKILLPIGISFYTFQALSYLFDVHNDVIEPERNPGRYALYLAFFPKLISGPIERGGNLLPQIFDPKPFDYQRLLDGLVRIGWGFFKKLIVADRLGVIVDKVFYAPGDFRNPVILVAVVAYSLQIYIDFSAYCDIAIGAAKILGIDLMENFNTPYFATSITDFWRRWHISLTSWLRDYIFTPLNFATRRKRSKFYQYINILIVFLVSGLWHGANYTFIIWGVLHGLYQVIELATQKVRNGIVNRFSINRESFGHRFFQITGTFLLVTFTWIFFRAENIHVAEKIIKSLFSFKDLGLSFAWNLTATGLPLPDILIMVFGLIILIIFEVAGRKQDLIKELNSQPLAFRWLVYLALIFAVILFGYFGVYTIDSFIYAQF
jgi:D-alanyl-lipoteichoic acid acyltransferase DltB (MBOAT superfamily)